MSEKKSRRDFLKQASAAVVGAGSSLPLLSTAACEGLQDHNLRGSERQWAMIIDIEKAEDPQVRQAAAEACRKAHNIPRLPDPDEEIEWIWDVDYGHVFEEQVHDRTPQELLETPVLVLCNHCTNPPCVRVCPTKATWKRESDGIVMMDMHRCIGCRYCMAACPYGARSFNWRDPRPFIETDAEGNFLTEFPTRSRGVVEKCNFCAERLREGLQPACVEAANEVAEGVMVFGDQSDPSSEVSRVLAETRTQGRRVSLGTGPNVYYIV